MSGPVSADARVGTELAGYRIEALIGRGGMSVVYLAEDQRLHRKVALKLIAPEVAQDGRFRERFLAESELAASLDHPNVVPIFEAGEEDGVFIAMRYVEGEDLKGLLQDGALSPERAIAVSAQIAGALDAAHVRGLVHRDVKPSNVLIDAAAGPAGHAYLADFGLTRRLTEQGDGVVSGLSMGTPSYVAPEQIRGEDVDGRADLYSLGCLLFECLAGEPPFRRSSEAATLFAHLEEEPPSLHARKPELAEPIDAVVARALDKSPEQRYGTCRELVEAAGEALGIGRPRSWSRTPLVVALVVALIVAAGLLAFFLVRGDGAPALPPSGGLLVRIDPTTNEVMETIAVGKSPSAVAIGESGVWVANRDDGTVWRINPDTNAVELEAEAHGAPADLAIQPEIGTFDQEALLVANGPANANIAAIATAGGAEENVISLAAGGSSNGLARIAAGEHGTWVATADRRIGRLNAGAGTLVRPVVVAPPPDERADSFFSGIAVDEDGVWVVGDPLDRTVWRLDPATGELVATIPLPFPPKDVAAGAEGVWVTSQLDDTVSRIDPATDEITATTQVGKGAAGVAVGAGSVWVANSIDGTVSRVDPRTLRVETIDIEGHPDDVAVGEDAVWVSAQAIPGLAGAAASDEVRLGVLGACEGDFGFLYDSSLAGALLPLVQRGGTLAGSMTSGVDGARVAGKRVEVLFGCTDGTAEKALAETRRLVESEGVDVLIGPTWLGEAYAIRDYARGQPGITFVNGMAAAQALTLTEPAPNFFSFFTDGAQWVAGLGDYAYHELGWRRVVTIGDARGFTYTHAAGFVAEFCALGGTVVEQIWVPVGAQDISRYTAEIPEAGVDGFLMAAFEPTILGFAEGLPQLEGNLADRVVGGFVLGFPELAEALGDRLDGVVFADKPGLGDSRPAWNAYIADFTEAFPELADFGGFPSSVAYYNSMEAVLQAFEAVDGDLSGGQRRFQEALADVELEAPDGHISLDERRQAIGQSFLIRWQRDDQGELFWTPLRTVENVEQTFNGYFSPGDPPPGQNTIECEPGNPPPWTSADGD